MEKADIGLVGLAVMGENLILNMESRGYTVAVFNRTVDKVDKFMAGRAKGKKIIGAHTLQELVASLKAPRKVMLMVKAGAAVDEFIEHLTPLLEKGDIIIDGGNSHFPDTIRRTKALEAKGLLYIGTGVSGGEEGALKGPSIMPGGSPAAWPAVKPIFQAIAAKVEDGTPCCDWVGSDGAGHFVKMVHNGIEYGDMQLICESYQIMKDLLGMSADEMHEVFAEWNSGDLDSYLIEITRDILAFKDKDGAPLVDKILDTAGQKGTGKWTSVTALDLGIPLTLISEAVYARIAFGDEGRARRGLEDPARTDAQIHRRQEGVHRRHRPRALRVEDRLLRAGLPDDAGRGGRVQMGPQLRRDRADVARRLHHPLEVPRQDQGGVRRRIRSCRTCCWRRSSPQKIEAVQESWRRVVATAAQNGIWIPATATALTYFDGFRNGRLPANLLQAQRDYFGAHQYERVDQPRGQFFHTNWTGRGGDTASSAYIV